MRILLDTHALLWWLADNPRLGSKARTILAAPDTEPHVSIVSLWEIAVKLRVGKLRADLSVIAATLHERGVRRLSIENSHLSALAQLPSFHRDPFDHLLVAQAIVEQLKLVTHDEMLARYPIEVIAAGR